ncbi:nucleic-acid-binding protein from transposon X-element [Trichonephila clavipes]|nr:nucleic-acid-binding protein from transposon X-element [Trichonephila clavipes]
MLRITLTFREQMKTLNDLMPKIRSKKTGEYIKLYTNTFEEYHELNNLLEKLSYEFYFITPKAQRPIKIVIKGLPKDTKTADIHSDRIDLGFTVDRITQLIGKITNQPLPVFLVSLPRNLHNAKIFNVNKLSYLSVTIDGYESRGVTQCFQCNKFNHTAENCHLKPRCLKCGEAHQTTDCQIKRVETMFCIKSVKPSGIWLITQSAPYS